MNSPGCTRRRSTLPVLGQTSTPFAANIVWDHSRLRPPVARSRNLAHSHRAFVNPDGSLIVPIRSLLYVPVSSERFVAKAHERGADAIILDLEDAVAPAQKAAARAALGAAVASVGQRGAIVFVRINAEADLIRHDAEAACRAGAFGLFVPKVPDVRSLLALAGFLDGIEHLTERRPMRLVPMIENPGALLDARSIAAATSRIFAMTTGGEDIATSLGA